MSFWQFLTILKARWKIALAVFGVTVLTAVAVSLLLPKKYTATTSVVIDLKSPDPITGMVLQGMLSPAIMATQMDIIQSPRTAKLVIDALRLTQSAELQQEWREDTEGKGAIEDWLAELLMKQLDVKPSRESNVMSITYTSPSPEFAQALANGFAKAYLDTATALRVQPAREYSKFFDVQAKQARETLEDAQTRLSAYQQKKGILVTDERLDVENARLNELTGQLVAVQAQATDSSSRQAQVGRSGEQMQEVTNSPLVAGLKSQLAVQRTKVSELRQRLGDAHPSLKEAEASVKELENRIAAETRTLTTGVSVSNTINQQRVKQLEASIAEQRQKVLRMKADRDEAAVLQRDVENAQRAYDAVVNRSNQTNLESQSQLSNVSVLHPAPLPIKHSSPKLLLNTAMAIFLGVLLAVTTSLLMELLDRRMRGPQDVVELAGIHVIGSLPRPGARVRRGKRAAMLSPAQRAMLAANQAASSLPAPDAAR